MSLSHRATVLFDQLQRGNTQPEQGGWLLRHKRRRLREEVGGRLWPMKICIRPAERKQDLSIAGTLGESAVQQAAAEFLTNPDKMQDLLRSAPKGWENKNMQAVLHVKVIGYQPVSVEVVATSYW